MKRQHVGPNMQMTLAAIILVGLLMAFSATIMSATSDDWLEVLVGFGMLLVIGLGGLWFSQHQLKFR